MLRALTPFVLLAACASGGSGPAAATPAVNKEFTLALGRRPRSMTRGSASRSRA